VSNRFASTELAKLQQQIERISNLSRSTQKFVSEVIYTLSQQAS
jgi:hypothetical protein